MLSSLYKGDRDYKDTTNERRLIRILTPCSENELINFITCENECSFDKSPKFCTLKLKMSINLFKIAH